MAYIYNLEKNAYYKLEFINNEMLEINNIKSDKEKWIPFIMSLHSPTKVSEISEESRATMTFYEINNLINGIDIILDCLKKQKKYSFNFCCIETFFEIRLENIIEDDVVEVEVWINLGTQTNGSIYGYDEGIRFVTSEKELDIFSNDLKENISRIIFDA